MKVPFQRPSILCRTFESAQVEETIDYMKSNMIDQDLAEIFENAFPNTIDTTIRWHTDGSQVIDVDERESIVGHQWQGPQSFIVTGDINAEWLRDSTNQLAQYQRLAKKDPAIHNLILGAINTQAEFVIESPYSNAFQPPPPSGLEASYGIGTQDAVHPASDPSRVFESKYELDSLAAFLSLGNQFYNHTGSTLFLTSRWYTALDTLLTTLDEQSQSTFDPESGSLGLNMYYFNRHTDSGTETLNLRGHGNPLNSGTGLVRSAFRPSDDACILQFLIPANAMMVVELRRTATILSVAGKTTLSKDLLSRAKSIEEGIYKHGVVEHKAFGKVFAYEVDGYGSAIFMDDANVPSLLSLPLLGFIDRDDKLYQNTRKMILSRKGNPYYLEGLAFKGIGGPHIGLRSAWPISVLVQAMTSDDDEEIKSCLKLVKRASPLGVIHESVNVDNERDYTRKCHYLFFRFFFFLFERISCVVDDLIIGPWFAWANSVFAQTILDLAERKPHLLFGENAKPYIIG